PGTCRPAVRHLHAGVPRRRHRAARRESEPERGRDAVLARRQPVPLHRIRQDHPRGARCGFGDERNRRMTATREFTCVGTRPVRHDGVDKVTGRASYGADVTWPGMLHGVVLRSPHAHARIVSIDTRAAEAIPGVQALITAKDLPETAAKIAIG